MRPSEANSAEQYKRLLQAKRACETCKPLLVQMATMDWLEDEALLIRRMTTAHNCPGTES